MPTAADDKYSRGVVGVRTGSTRYPGAAVLGVQAAWRTGVGMVRYLGPPTPTDLVLRARPETVTAEGRVQAWVIGSGTDADERTEADTATLRGILSGAEPVVVDAGALDLAPAASAPRILTPHDREHDRLRSALGLTGVDVADPGAREAAVAETARTLGATVLLKGFVTIVADAEGWVAHVSSGTPWLAAAGTGDVLAGAIGAVLAGACASTSAPHLGSIAATGAWLHGRAAALAASAAGGAAGNGPITALDVADHLPRAVAEALRAGHAVHAAGRGGLGSP